MQMPAECLPSNHLNLLTTNIPIKYKLAIDLLSRSNNWFLYDENVYC